MLNVTIYQQINDYTCGPAALLTAISHFGDVPAHLNEQMLSRMMATNREEGTPNDAMKAVAKRLGFYADSSRQKPGQLGVVHDQLMHDRPVIVVYNDPEHGYHFAVLVGDTEKEVILADPWSKSFKTLERQEFEERWVDSQGNREWWMSLGRPPDARQKVAGKYQIRHAPRSN